jgi:hypothetical protein
MEKDEVKGDVDWKKEGLNKRTLLLSALRLGFQGGQNHPGESAGAPLELLHRFPEIASILTFWKGAFLA